ncbi:MAG: hypothetical protein ACK55Z_17925, partial [bacterium]
SMRYPRHVLNAAHARRLQVLATARCFGTLIEQLEALSRGGTAHRQRMVELGGGQLLTCACRAAYLLCPAFSSHVARSSWDSHPPLHDPQKSIQVSRVGDPYN